MDFEAVKNLRVLLVGDAIMDEYIYVHCHGKAVKENALASSMRGREVFRGGVWAAAAHVRNFVRHVDVMTGNTIMWNSRMVDDVYMRKLFVTHEARKHEEEQPFFDIENYDLVIVCDFGHGAINKELRGILEDKAKFLAVNTQTNSINYGFNVITKYDRADYVVVDELEARLAAQDNESPIEEVIGHIGFVNLVVTQGTHGAIGWNGKAFHRAKALTDHAIDTMGAGDAFFVVSALFAATYHPMPDLLKIGNAAGAAKVGIIGHRQSVDRELLEKYLG